MQLVDDEILEVLRGLSPAGVFAGPELILGNQGLLLDPGVVKVFGELIGIGNHGTTYDSVEIQIRTRIVCTAWIGSSTAHLVARENVDLVSRLTLLVGDPVHVEAIEIGVEIGQSRRCRKVGLENAAAFGR